MGSIARMLSFVRAVRNGAKLSDVKFDPDGGSLITGEHFADPGDDSHPLPDDTVVATSVQRTGGEVPVGYADTVNGKVSGPGEKRIYGRDPATGSSVNQVWLKADGSVIISNANGAIELKADGSVDINGAIVSVAGEVTNQAGIVLGTHTHSQGVDSDGNTQAETEAPS